MEVAAVTSFLFVRSSSRGMSSRYAAVKAPEVMTRMSSVIVVLISSTVRALQLLILQPFIPKACEGSRVYDAGASSPKTDTRIY